MARIPSDATKLRSAQFDLRVAKKQLLQVQTECNNYRVRATKAEQEVSEWKRRFDKLLNRDETQITGE